MKTFLTNLIRKFRHRDYLRVNSTPLQLVLFEQFRRAPKFPLLYQYGFKEFSQHEEDGIILYIFSQIGFFNRQCVEMCCGNGLEANTTNLIVNHFFTGLLFDGSQANVNLASWFFTNHPNTKISPPIIAHSWITRENVNDLIESNGTVGEIDLFSLDMDGVDYHVLKALRVISPRVIVLEFNHLLGPTRSLTVPYSDSFRATFTKDGTDYAGASLNAFIKLLNERDYRFVGTNRFATNAFFVRNDAATPSLEQVKDPAVYFHHKRVIYGVTERANRIKNMDWEEV